MEPSDRSGRLRTSRRTTPTKRIRIALAGCGSVSSHYLADLRRCEHAEVVAVCDTDALRAASRAAEFGIPRACAGAAEMLAEVEFDMLVNTTPMPVHAELNHQALSAGKHVWSEKPFAEDLDDARQLIALAQSKGVRLLAAPTVVTSPAFAAMARVIASGRIGNVYAARAWYGHGGPGWGPWFYGPGGGAMYDLAVYNITTLTGLLGPARSVVALTGTAIPERRVDGTTVRAVADDNLAVLMDHGGCAYSSVQSGFVYGSYCEDRTIEVVGTQGSVAMLGWDWLPNGIEVRRAGSAPEVLLPGAQGYCWDQGASLMARCLATGEQPPLTIEHAYHALEVMLAAHESSASGRRVEVESTFSRPWAVAPDSASQAPAAIDPESHVR